MPKPLDFNYLREALNDLSLVQARQLQAELTARIQDLEQQSAESKQATNAGREVVEVKHIGDRIYQLERVRCGKAGCKCAGKNAVLHGPYWYVYWRQDSKLKSRYVGKRFREME